MPIIGYEIEPEDFAKLLRINSRLYDDRPLTGDDRRDLANELRVILNRAIPVSE